VCGTRDHTVGIVSQPTADGRHNMPMCSSCITRDFGIPDIGQYGRQVDAYLTQPRPECGARLSADAPVFDEVFRWHWLEWGISTPNADERGWRTQLASRCRHEGIPFTVIASLDREPVGSVSVCEDDRDVRYGDRGPWLSGMVVVGPARNMGVGRELLSAAAEGVRQAAATELWVWTTEAGPFYERCGYQYAHRKENLRDRSVLYLAL
jgi:GNAT superfamily N-acetyltransferase